MRFKPSIKAEEFVESVFPRVGARNKAVLGRSALFLALGEGLPNGWKSPDSGGKDLDDSTVVGDELRDLVRAALHSRAGAALNDASYIASFKTHFDYGCGRLRDLWEESGHDQVGFVELILELAGAAQIESDAPAAKSGAPLIENEVRLQLLREGEAWSINGPGTKNGLLVISGEPGSGKSQLALDLLAQLSAQKTRFLFSISKANWKPPKTTRSKPPIARVF